MKSSSWSRRINLFSDWLLDILKSRSTGQCVFASWECFWSPRARQKGEWLLCLCPCCWSKYRGSHGFQEQATCLVLTGHPRRQWQSRTENRGRGSGAACRLPSLSTAWSSAHCTFMSPIFYPRSFECCNINTYQIISLHARRLPSPKLKQERHFYCFAVEISALPHLCVSTCIYARTHTGLYLTVIRKIEGHNPCRVFRTKPVTKTEMKTPSFLCFLDLFSFLDCAPEGFYVLPFIL